MIHVVCGLIGAGKTTYARSSGGIVVDLHDDDSSVCLNKDEQIRTTLSYDDQGIDVWHITLYPTIAEEAAFMGRSCEYIWVNTTIAKAMENVVKRGRERDISDLSQTRKKQTDVLMKYVQSSLRFKIVNVFETNERW